MKPDQKKRAGQRIIYLLIVPFLCILSSCEPELSFTEPQPFGDKDENIFKNRYQGAYLCLEDSSILQIDKDRIIQEWHLVGKVDRAQIDTIEGIVFKDGQLYTESNRSSIMIEPAGDSILMTYQAVDTIFQLSDNQVLRYYKGRYFLNYKENGDSWSVRTLNLDRKGVLTIDKINGGEEEIQKIKKVTRVEKITDQEGELVDYKIQPTKKELKEILKSDFFKEGSRYQKIKE